MNENVTDFIGLIKVSRIDSITFLKGKKSDNSYIQTKVKDFPDGRLSLKMAVTCTDHWESAAEPAGQEHHPGRSLPGPALSFLPKVRKGEKQTTLPGICVFFLLHVAQ